MPSSRHLFHAITLVAAVSSSCLVVAAASAGTATDSLAIEVQATAGGVVVPDGITLVARGGAQSFQFLPSGCNTVSDVIVDDVSMGPQASYSFTNVQADHLLYVVFGIGAPTLTTLLDPLSPAGVCSRPDTLIAHVTGGDVGQVEFYEDDQRVGISSLVSGTARAILRPPLTLGAHHLFARYLGSTCAQSSDSSPINFTAPGGTPDSLEVRLTASPNPASPYETITLNASLWANGNPLTWFAGSATIYDRNQNIGAMSFQHGVGSLRLGMSVGNPLATGSHVLMARVDASDCFSARSSNRVFLDIADGSETSLALTSSATSVHPGQVVTFEVRVTPVITSGVVSFRDVATNALLGTTSLAGGVASLAYTATRGAEFGLRASYAGDRLRGGSVSDSVHLKVVGTLPTTTTFAIDPAEMRRYYETVRFAVQVSPPSATGVIHFAYPSALPGDFNSPSGPGAPLANGALSLEASFSQHGRMQVIAEYLGDSLFDTSRDTAEVLLMGPSTNTVILDPTNPSRVGEPATFTCVVGPLESVGTVTFYIDSLVRNVSPIVIPVENGVAQLTTSALGLGDHSIYAVWSEEHAKASPGISHRIVDAGGVRLKILAPNGGEDLLVGQTVEIRWVPYPFTLYEYYYPAVQLWIARAPGAPWELIGGGQNTGSFLWTVTGPGTNTGQARIYSARIRATGHGYIPEGVSDQPFSIFDATTETAANVNLLAEATAKGVRISWVLPRTVLGSLELQRAADRSGPWAPLDVAASSDGDGGHVVVDRTVVAAETYWYRLSGSAGTLAGVGPVSARADAATNFALELVGPNPAHGYSSLSFSVARVSHVRLSILDLQGREVDVLVDGVRAPGAYSATWDGRAAGVGRSSGLYFVRYSTPERVLVRRLSIVR